MLTYCKLPKVGIKLLEISYVRILFFNCFLTFVAAINPYSVFKFLIFKCSSLVLSSYMIDSTKLLAYPYSPTKMWDIPCINNLAIKRNKDERMVWLATRGDTRMQPRFKY